MLEFRAMNGKQSASKGRPAKLLDAESLWSFALKTLGSRALTAAELREKLRRRASLASDVDTVLAKLKDYGFLNDSRFAEHYAAMRKENDGLGKARVLRDLRQRRVSSNVAETAVTAAFQGADETQMVEQFLQRKFRGKNLTEYLQEEKHLAAAYRRLRYAGFSSGASIRVLKRFASQASDLEGIELEGDTPPGETE
jgi:regulatory protein